MATTISRLSFDLDERRSLWGLSNAFDLSVDTGDLLV